MSTFRKSQIDFRDIDIYILHIYMIYVGRLAAGNSTTDASVSGKDPLAFLGADRDISVRVVAEEVVVLLFGETRSCWRWLRCRLWLRWRLLPLLCIRPLAGARPPRRHWQRLCDGDQRRRPASPLDVGAHCTCPSPNLRPCLGLGRWLWNAPPRRLWHHRGLRLLHGGLARDQSLAA